MKKVQKMRSRSAGRPDYPIRIGLFGQFFAEIDGVKVTVPGRKCQALLAYLAAKQGQYVSRDTLCGLIWGDRGDEQARASLRQALAVIRKSFGKVADDVLVSSNSSIGIRLDVVTVDTCIFTAAIAGGNVAAAIAVCVGGFLDGFGAVDPEFDRWMDVERAIFRASLVQCLQQELVRHETERNIAQVIAVAVRLLAIDDLQEDVCRALMRAQMQQRDFNGALRQYDLLRERLINDLGVRPEPETDALMHEVRTARQEKAVPNPSPLVDLAADRTKRPSVAVLPFRALGEGAEIIGEGVADDIIVELSRSSELSVISRQSSFRFVSDQSGVREIGQILGVRFCLSGAVQMSGVRLRLTARLDRCDDGETVWSERFDSKRDELFDLQTEIARVVTATVVGRIAASDTQFSNLQRPGNLAAYDHVLRGLQCFHRHVHEDMEAARNEFRAAIKLDPNYARAFGLLAMTDIYMQWLFGPDGDVSAAVAAAQTAVKLDVREIKGLCALGIINMLAYDFGRARHLFETALSFNNNDDLLLLEYGRFMMYDDRPEDGIASVNEAMRLNPFHPNWYWNIIGRCLHSLGRYEEAISILEKISSPNFWTLLYLAGCHAKIGNSSKAALLRGQVLSIRPDLNIESLLPYFPYKNQDTKTRLFESFRAAGFR